MDAELASDEDLLVQVAHGDSPALVSLFRRRRREVYRFAVHMLGDAAAAEDVTQDVFMTVIREAGRFDAQRGTAVAWLCGIARNLVRRRLERERVLEPLGVAHEGVPCGHAGAEPLQHLARAERIAMLRRAVMALPLRYREVILLCDLQELSYADAALALDCAVGTVRSRLHRGRALLAAKLRKLEDTSRNVKLPGSRCLA